MKNRMMRMPEKGHLVEMEEEIPEIKENQVLVRIEYCGICGSDMHFFQN